MYAENETDQWLTPPLLIKACGPFDLDPCCPLEMPWRTAERNFSFPREDGLMLPWGGTVWLNPPYGRSIGPWVERIALHDDGLLLIFSRTETRAFERVWKTSKAMLFFYQRLSFF